MPCNLIPSTTSREDFIGTTGSVVTVKLEGPGDAKAEIVHIRYAGDEIDSEPPYQFTLKANAKMLVVLVEASKAGALVKLIEVCGPDSEQVLDRFHYDPMNPARGYIIRGSGQ